jgi:hypothetical protein
LNPSKKGGLPTLPKMRVSGEKNPGFNFKIGTKKEQRLNQYRFPAQWIDPELMLEIRERKSVEITIENLAEMLYERYCEEVGGHAFNGQPLPTWKEFRADQTKRIQSNAWVRVASLAALIAKASTLEGK